MPSKQPLSNGVARTTTGEELTISIPEVPVTQEHPPWTQHKNVKQAGLARANAAVTESNPHGTTEGNYTEDHSNQTVLQQHVDFFDINKDGVITPFETFIALRSINWSILLTIIAVLFIHGGLSYATLDPGNILPDPFFRIYVRNIHRAKHGSDTATYDSEGRFRPQMFEDIFAKWGEKKEDGQWGITFRQALQAIKGNRSFMDLFGMSAAIFEWFATYVTIWPEDGVMMLEDVRAVYDGSYFYKVADKCKPAIATTKEE
ncbi:Caleosin related protein-domain-containing protein [Cristinia sonorae]|uniref:Caleosin related protein-domain-containing protein n=1 Tax=Cristinia sonorae TaxID=1940300 RepID=A0A8K0UPR4_9AGAR|nr:Caleosin related protein-domain-containing protein [Cristinia sonorae]